MDAPEIKIFVEAGEWPPKRKLRGIAKRAVKAAVEALSKEVPSRPSLQEGAELSLVFTDDEKIRTLNFRYRGKGRATNVLSFPQKSGALLGDVILAAETVASEAALVDKPLEDHMAHLIIHGFLHLLGYDHQREAEAAKMEQLERVALEILGVSDPYAPATSR